MKKKFKKGFTLLEILLITSIVAILAVIIIPNVSSKSISAKMETANTNALYVRNAAVNAFSNVNKNSSHFQADILEYYGQDGSFEQISPDSNVTQHIKHELGSTFKGYWYVKLDESGNIKYVLWSKTVDFTADDADKSQLSKDDCQDKKGYVGCYPLKNS